LRKKKKTGFPKGEKGELGTERDRIGGKGEKNIIKGNWKLPERKIVKLTRHTLKIISKGKVGFLVKKVVETGGGILLEGGGIGKQPILLWNVWLQMIM